ncbi:MAG: hypothetical protein AB1847_16665 [bacterium]
MKAKLLSLFISILIVFLLFNGCQRGSRSFHGTAYAQSFKASTIHAPDGKAGTNQAATSLTLEGGRATGSAAGGDIIFKTSDAGSSGTAVQSWTTKMILKTSGKLGINVTSPTAYFDANMQVIRLRLTKTPASATAAGNKGDICWDANYIYVCIDPNNNWKRCPLSTW